MAEAAEAKKRGTLPPYIAFKTLLDIVERMSREEPPTRVDGSYLESYAGGYRPTVINNLFTLGLLNAEGEPTERLLALIKADEAGRKELVAEMIRQTYPTVVGLQLNSTQGQFLEQFSALGAAGDTRRKAVSFFLKAAAYAGVSTGTHWKTPAAATSGTSKRRVKVDPQVKVTETQQGAVVGDFSGEIVSIDLGNAGSVVVHVDVKWLQLDDDTFIALRRSISDLKALVRDEPGSRSDGASETTNTNETNDDEEYDGEDET